MNKDQEECSEPLVLGKDGKWFCPKCGFIVEVKKAEDKRQIEQELKKLGL